MKQKFNKDDNIYNCKEFFLDGKMNKDERYSLSQKYFKNIIFCTVYVLVFCCMTDRPTDQVNYIMDINDIEILHINKNLAVFLE